MLHRRPRAQFFITLDDTASSWNTLCEAEAPMRLRDSEHVNTPRGAVRLLSRGT